MTERPFGKKGIQGHAFLQLLDDKEGYRKDRLDRARKAQNNGYSHIAKTITHMRFMAILNGNLVPTPEMLELLTSSADYKKDSEPYAQLMALGTQYIAECEKQAKHVKVPPKTLPKASRSTYQGLPLETENPTILLLDKLCRKRMIKVGIKKELVPLDESKLEKGVYERLSVGKLKDSFGLNSAIDTIRSYSTPSVDVVTTSLDAVLAAIKIAPKTPEWKQAMATTKKWVTYMEQRNEEKAAEKAAAKQGKKSIGQVSAQTKQGDDFRTRHRKDEHVEQGRVR